MQASNSSLSKLLPAFIANTLTQAATARVAELQKQLESDEPAPVPPILPGKLFLSPALVPHVHPSAAGAPAIASGAGPFIAGLPKMSLAEKTSALASKGSTQQMLEQSSKLDLDDTGPLTPARLSSVPPSPTEIIEDSPGPDTPKPSARSKAPARARTLSPLSIASCTPGRHGRSMQRPKPSRSRSLSSKSLTPLPTSNKTQRFAAHEIRKQLFGDRPATSRPPSVASQAPKPEGYWRLPS